MALTKKLEDPKYPLLGPNLRILKVMKMGQTIRFTTRVLCNYSIHVFDLMFVISQYLELWLIRDDMELALRNISVTMLSMLCAVKAWTYILWGEHWNELIEYATNLEKQQRFVEDAVTASIISEYTTYARQVTYFYWCLVTGTVFTVILAPLFSFMASAEHRYLIRNGTVPYPEVLSSWLPIDHSRGSGYWISVLVDSALCVYGGGVIAGYDPIAVVLMSFLKGQLRILSVNCARLFGDGNKSIDYDETVEKIRKCHEHHIGLVRFSTVLNSVLSPVMFLYVIICSLMICASAIQLTMEGIGTMQRIWVIEYLIALISQLFLYCWHSNEVLYMSDKVEDGMYSSAWWSQEARTRRSALLLAGQLRRSIVFTAGPFTDLSVSTFVAILKGSYSYYTLLSKK